MYEADVSHFQEAKRLARGNQQERLAYWQDRRQKIDGIITEREKLAGRFNVSDNYSIDTNIGYKAFPAATFPESDAILRAADDVFQNLDVDDLVETNKKFDNHAYKPQLLHIDLDKQHLDVESPFFKFALGPDLIASISSYFGVVPILYRVNYWYSRYVDAEQPINSQIFHLDWDDMKTIRVFLYVTDVTEDQGPMVILNAEESVKVSNELDRRRIKYWRVSDEDMYSIVEPSHFQSLAGPRGLTAMADPASCYHYGSRARPGSSPRFLVSFWYVSPAAFWLPLDTKAGYPYLRLADSGGLDTVQKLVLGGAE